MKDVTTVRYDAHLIARLDFRIKFFTAVKIKQKINIDNK